MKKELKLSVVATTLLMGVSPNLSAADTYDISWDSVNNKAVYSKNGGTNQNISGDFDSGELTEQSNNTVNINLGSNSFSINNGISGGGDVIVMTYTKVSGNTVTLNSGTVKWIDGGTALTGEVSGNKVIINGGTILNSVYGGETDSGTVSGNSVTINGGTINGSVHGGFSIKNTVTNNTVNFTGGTIKGAIYGGLSDDSSKDMLSGNTLNIGTSDKPVIGLSAENIHNFQTINFYLPSSVSNGDTALSLTTTENTGLADTKVNAYLSNANGLTKDSVIHLISTAGTLVDFEEANGKANLSNVNIAGLINVTGKIAVDSTEKNLDLTFSGDEDTGGGSTGGGSTITADENAKSLLETNLAMVGVVNEGANLFIANLDKINPGEAEVFAFANGVDKRLKTGSHVDIKGFNVNVGVASDDTLSGGNLTTGLFVEYGKGSYESKLDNGTKGEGDTEFIGGGAFARYSANNGFYGEISGRVGKAKVDYEKSLYDAFDISSTYYGAHLGFGKIFNLTNSNDLDIYARGIYSKTAGDDLVLSGVNTHFDSVTSLRAQIGFKDSFKLSDTSKLYAGLAYQYEFDGESKGNLTLPTFGTAEIAAPKLKGSTGIAELGYAYETNSIKFDIGAKGYTGKEKGYSGNLGVTIKF